MQNPITKKSQQGFTLIELLIVVAIIGILAAIAIPQYASYRVQTMNAGAKSAVKNLETAQEGFYSESNWHYTKTKDDLAFSPSDDVVYDIVNSSDPYNYGICAYHQGGDKIYFVNSTMSNLENVHNCSTAGDCDSTGITADDGGCGT